MPLHAPRGSGLRGLELVCRAEDHELGPSIDLGHVTRRHEEGLALFDHLVAIVVVDDHAVTEHSVPVGGTGGASRAAK
jgi:hypothetical protein